jgi:hypothetical protein
MPMTLNIARLVKRRSQTSPADKLLIVWKTSDIADLALNKQSRINANTSQAQQQPNILV